MLKLIIPCTQVPEAIANILHVVCFDDYLVNTVLLGTVIPSSIVVDVGAFLGFFTLYVGLLMKREGLIVAVEPNPYARNYLYKNLLENGFENMARVDPRLICASSGWKKLYLTQYWALSSTNPAYIKEMNEEIVAELRLPCITLRQLLGSHKLDRIDLLKIDIEGLEANVLEQALKDNMLEKNRVRAIIVETHYPRDNVARTLSALLRAVRDKGYEVIEINPLIPAWKQVIVVVK
ncbi:FkbM family methyltransferase [Pyrofollis japonicus]|uniref:FkbM family methyltransferase n=1 Tax=Pyrofollis japonicus TaxID=3060460 RepID=UPI00295B987C|nr:FkbM family methyltransferase [Pyrofollis japonicus]